MEIQIKITYPCPNCDYQLDVVPGENMFGDKVQWVYCEKCHSTYVSPDGVTWLLICQSNPRSGTEVSNAH